MKTQHHHVFGTQCAACIRNNPDKHRELTAREFQARADRRRERRRKRKGS